jgi:hypothetical protein
LVDASNKTVFNSWGYKNLDVVSANEADRQLPKAGKLPTFSKGALGPFDETTNANVSAALKAASNKYLSSTPQVPTTLNFSPAPAPASTPIPTPTYAIPITPITISVPTSTAAVKVSVDSTSPSQKIIMAQTNALIYAINFAETSGVEAVNLKGLTITATYSEATNAGGVNTNTGFNTFKKFSLVNGSTVISKNSWANTVNPTSNTYTIDFLTDQPLNFQISPSGSLVLQLKVDLNDWSTNAAVANWNFSIAVAADLKLVGQSSQYDIVPTLQNKAISPTVSVVKQPVSFYPITSVGGVASAQAFATGTPATQETVGIFNLKSTSSTAYLTSLTIVNTGSALPTGTNANVSYYIYDASVGVTHPIGVSNGPGKVQLNLNSAWNKGLMVSSDGSTNIIIKADTTNFINCGVACTPIYSYTLQVSNWEWLDSTLPGKTFTGPYAPDIAKNATFVGNVTTRNY